MNIMKPGHRVRIHTWTNGCYNDLTGIIKAMVTDDKVTAEQQGFEFSALFPGWLRVKLDKPANNGGTLVYDDVFIPWELTIIQ